MMGWEQLFKGHFLLVEDDDKEEDEQDAVLFDNLWLGDDFRMSITQVEQTLEKFTIPLPLGIKHRLREHEEMNIGNLIEVFENCRECGDLYEISHPCGCYECE